MLPNMTVGFGCCTDASGTPCDQTITAIKQAQVKLCTPGRCVLRSTHSLRQREFLQLQCFLGAAALPGRPPRALPLLLR
jgi:hypothetical protein